MTKTLIDIDGIGPASVKKLAAASITSLADLAGADPEVVAAIEGLPTVAAVSAWIEEAKKFQAASGAEVKTEGAAASDDGSEAKAEEVKDASAVDPAGTTDGSAPSEEESREQAEAASADRKDAVEEEKQPEETAQPPVAEQTDGPVLVVTGPKKGRWRAGLQFGREPRRLTHADLGEGLDGARRLVALGSDPALRCVFVAPDGSEEALDADTVAQIEAVILAAEQEVTAAPVSELVSSLLEERG